MNYNLTVPTLACSACVEAITRAIHAQEPHAQITADLNSKIVTIVSQAPEALLRQAIEEAGHEIEP
jgi:copper chaperone